MSARGDAARRASWAAKDKQWGKAQLDAALDSWLTSLPAHLIQRLENDMLAIFGKRYRSTSLNATAEERDQVLAVLNQINLAWGAGHDPSDSQPGQKEISMSLEQAIQALTAAVEANTLQLQKGGSVSVSTTTGKPPKENKAPKATKTREELSAVMEKVKGAHGTAIAKGLIAEIGKATKLAEVAEENVDALYAAAEEKANEEAM